MYEAAVLRPRMAVQEATTWPERAERWFKNHTAHAAALGLSRSKLRGAFEHVSWASPVASAREISNQTSSTHCAGPEPDTGATSATAAVSSLASWLGPVVEAAKSQARVALHAVATAHAKLGSSASTTLPRDDHFAAVDTSIGQAAIALLVETVIHTATEAGRGIVAASVRARPNHPRADRADPSVEESPFERVMGRAENDVLAADRMAEAASRHALRLLNRVAQCKFDLNTTDSRARSDLTRLSQEETAALDAEALEAEAAARNAELAAAAARRRWRELQQGGCCFGLGEAEKDVGVAVFCEVARAVLAASCDEITALSESLGEPDAKAGVSAAKALMADAVLQRSVVGAVTRPLVVCLLAMDEAAPVAGLLLPSVVHFTERVASLVELLPQPRANVRSLAGAEASWLASSGQRAGDDILRATMTGEQEAAVGGGPKGPQLGETDEASGAAQTVQQRELAAQRSEDEASGQRLHWLVDLERTCASLGAKLAARMVRSVPLTEVEEEMKPWLGSSVASSGLEAPALRELLHRCCNAQAAAGTTRMEEGHVYDWSWSKAMQGQDLDQDQDDSSASVSSSISDAGQGRGDAASMWRASLHKTARWNAVARANSAACLEVISDEDVDAIIQAVKSASGGVAASWREPRAGTAAGKAALAADGPVVALLAPTADGLATSGPEPVAGAPSFSAPARGDVDDADLDAAGDAVAAQRSAGGVDLDDGGSGSMATDAVFWAVADNSTVRLPSGEIVPKCGEVILNWLDYLSRAGPFVEGRRNNTRGAWKVHLLTRGLDTCLVAAACKHAGLGDWLMAVLQAAADSLPTVLGVCGEGDAKPSALGPSPASSLPVPAKLSRDQQQALAAAMAGLQRSSHAASRLSIILANVRGPLQELFSTSERSGTLRRVRSEALPAPDSVVAVARGGSGASGLVAAAGVTAITTQIALDTSSEQDAPAAAAASATGPDEPLVDGAGAASGASARVSPRIDAPVAMDLSLAQATRRARFLLALAPASRLGVATLPSGKRATSQLEASWGNSLEPHVVAPLLSRWRSTGGADVGDHADEDDADARAAAVNEHLPMACQMILSSCALYVRYGATAPPRVLLPALLIRQIRASQRRFGLKAFGDLLRFAAHSSARRDVLVQLRPALRVERAVWPRAAFLAASVAARRTPASTDDGLAGEPPAAASPAAAASGASPRSESEAPLLSALAEGEPGRKPIQNRPFRFKLDDAAFTGQHHYTSGLEGVSQAAADAVQAAWMELMLFVGDLVTVAARAGDSGLAHAGLWVWTQDLQLQDNEFVLRTGMLPVLGALFSLKAHADRTASTLAVARRARLALHSGTATGSALFSSSAAAVAAGWRAWPVQFVQKSLLGGTLSMWEVVLHMQAHGCPATTAGSELWRKSNLDGSPEAIVRQSSVAQLGSLYAAFVAEVSKAKRGAKREAKTTGRALRSDAIIASGRTRVPPPQLPGELDGLDIGPSVADALAAGVSPFGGDVSPSARGPGRVGGRTSSATRTDARVSASPGLAPRKSGGAGGGMASPYQTPLAMTAADVSASPLASGLLPPFPSLEAVPAARLTASEVVGLAGPSSQLSGLAGSAARDMSQAAWALFRVILARACGARSTALEQSSVLLDVDVMAEPDAPGTGTGRAAPVDTAGVPEPGLLPDERPEDITRQAAIPAPVPDAIGGTHSASRGPASSLSASYSAAVTEGRILAASGEQILPTAAVSGRVIVDALLASEEPLGSATRLLSEASVAAEAVATMHTAGEGCGSAGASAAGSGNARFTRGLRELCLTLLLEEMTVATAALVRRCVERWEGGGARAGSEAVDTAVSNIGRLVGLASGSELLAGVLCEATSCIEQTEAASRLHRCLLLVVSLRRLPAVTVFLARSGVLSLLVLITRVAPLRSQRLAIQALTAALPASVPADATIAVGRALAVRLDGLGSAESTTRADTAAAFINAESVPGAGAVSWLLLLAGSSLALAADNALWSQAEGQHHFDQPVPTAAGALLPRGSGSGYTLQALGSAATAALRTLSRVTGAHTITALPGTGTEPCGRPPSGGLSAVSRVSSGLCAVSSGWAETAAVRDVQSSRDAAARPGWAEAFVAALAGSLSATDGFPAPSALVQSIVDGDASRVAARQDALDAVAAVAAAGIDYGEAAAAAEAISGPGTASQEGKVAFRAASPAVSCVGEQLRTTLAAAAGTLFVLGGMQEVLRAGGRAVTLATLNSAGPLAGKSVLASKHSHIVIRASPNSSKVRILQRGTNTIKAHVATSLIPVDAEPSSPSLAALLLASTQAAAFVEGLLAFHKPPPATKRDIPKRMRTAVADEGLREPNEWWEAVDGPEHAFPETSDASVPAPVAGSSPLDDDEEEDGVSLQWHGVVELRVSLMGAIASCAKEPVLVASFARRGLFQHVLRLALQPAAIEGVLPTLATRCRVTAVNALLLDSVAAALLIGGRPSPRKGPPPLTPEQQRRRDKASGLAEMSGRSLELCEEALRQSGDDADRAFAWLFDGQADVYERHAGSGAGPEAGGGSNPEREAASRELAGVLGIPAILALRALELHTDNREHAAAWLLEQGPRYIPGLGLPDVPESEYSGFGTAEPSLEEALLGDGRGGDHSGANDAAIVDDLEVGTAMDWSSDFPDAGEGRRGAARGESFAAVRAAAEPRDPLAFVGSGDPLAGDEVNVMHAILRRRAPETALGRSLGIDARGLLGRALERVPSEPEEPAARRHPVLRDPAARATASRVSRRSSTPGLVDSSDSSSDGMSSSVEWDTDRPVDAEHAIGTDDDDMVGLVESGSDVDEVPGSSGSPPSPDDYMMFDDIPMNVSTGWDVGVPGLEAGSPSSPPGPHPRLHAPRRRRVRRPSPPEPFPGSESGSMESYLRDMLGDTQQLRTVPGVQPLDADEVAALLNGATWRPGFTPDRARLSRFLERRMALSGADQASGLRRLLVGAESNVTAMLDAYHLEHRTARGASGTTAAAKTAPSTTLSRGILDMATRVQPMAPSSRVIGRVDDGAAASQAFAPLPPERVGATTLGWHLLAAADRDGSRVSYGVAVAQCSGSHEVRLAELDTGTGHSRLLSVPMGRLRCIGHVCAVPVATTVDLQGVSAAVLHSLGAREAREAVASMLLSWPEGLLSPLDTAATAPGVEAPAVSIDVLLRLVRLAAASEGMSVGALGATSGSNKQLELRELHKGLRAGVGGRFELPRGGSTLSALQAVLQQAVEHETVAAPADGMAETVLEHAKGDILLSTKPSSTEKRTMRESLHPHTHRGSSADSVEVAGATALWVTFDPRCSTGRGRTLTFCTGAASSTRIASFSGPGSAWKPFVVHGNRVRFQFEGSCNPSEVGWGFRFHVVPMRGLRWASEADAASHGSLAFGCWLFEFLLRDCPAIVNRGLVHSASTFDALAGYLRARGSPDKHRVVSLLVRLLKNPDFFPLHGPPSLASLRSMEPAIMTHCETLLSGGTHNILPPRLLKVVELLIASRIAEQAIEARKAASTSAASSAAAASAAAEALPAEPEPVTVAGADVERLPLMEVLIETMELVEAIYSRSQIPRSVAARCAIDAGLADDSSACTPELLDSVVRDMTTWKPHEDDSLVRWLTAITSSARRARIAKAKARAAEASAADASAGAPRPRIPGACGAGGATDPGSLRPAALVLDNANDTATYGVLTAVPLASLRTRAALLVALNRRLNRTMALVDSVGASEEYSMGFKLRSLSHCIFFKAKQTILQSAINATASRMHGMGSITVSNHAMYESAQAALRDPAMRAPGIYKGPFATSFDKLFKKGPAAFRCAMGDHDALFHVSFDGERGVDQGGLFRDFFSRICDDAFAAHSDLFMPTPNRLHEAGTGMDMYLPNPAANSAVAGKLFEYLGRLIGMSIRQRLYMPYDLPGIMWKLICNQKPTLADLAEVDVKVAEQLGQIAECQADHDFETMPAISYSIQGATGTMLELFPGGADKPVEFGDKEAYVAAAIEARVQELSFGADAIRFGLQSVVPKRALALFTAAELEQAACGDPMIDLELLRRNTEYKNGYSESHEAVQRFWRVLDEFSDDHRSRVIRFAWGRSRLPAEKDFKQRFKLSTQHSTQNLPVAHTCYFQIDLPPYETDDKMRAKLFQGVSEGLSGHFLMA